MKRKIVRHGSNTLTISLPSKWCRAHDIVAGEELDVNEKGKTLIVSGHEATKEQSITIDITNLDRRTILSYIQGIYRYGYDNIEIISRDAVVPFHRIEKNINLSNLIYEIANRMVGAEVISASKKGFVIKRIAEESFEDFPAVLRRIFLLLNEMMEALIDGAKKNDREMLQSIEFHHVNLKKFLNFCLRLLNKYGYEDARKTCFYFNIISLLSKTEDIIKNNSRYIIMYDIHIKSEQVYDLLKDIQKSINDFYKLFYSFSLTKAIELNIHRHKFRRKLFNGRKNLTKEENIIIGGLSQITELILDMTETRMALE